VFPGVAKVRSEGFHLSQSVTLLGPILLVFGSQLMEYRAQIAVLRRENSRWVNRKAICRLQDLITDVLTYLLTYSKIRTRYTYRHTLI